MTGNGTSITVLTEQVKMISTLASGQDLLVVLKSGW